MPDTPSLTPILELEEQLQAAWRRRDGAAAVEARAKLHTLWERRREELAALAKRAPSAWDTMPFSVRRA